MPQACRRQGSALSLCYEGVRARACNQGGTFVLPLAVSAQRGVAALVNARMRALIIDLEEDEEEAEGEVEAVEEEGGGEEMEDSPAKR